MEQGARVCFNLITLKKIGFYLSKFVKGGRVCLNLGTLVLFVKGGKVCFDLSTLGNLSFICQRMKGVF